MVMIGGKVGRKIIIKKQILNRKNCNLISNINFKENNIDALHKIFSGIDYVFVVALAQFDSIKLQNFIKDVYFMI